MSRSLALTLLLLLCVASCSRVTETEEQASCGDTDGGQRVRDKEQLLAGHDAVLHRLQTAVEGQDRLLHDAYVLIRQQAAQLSHQERLLSEQSAELSRQQHLLSRQEDLLRELGEQDDWLWLNGERRGDSDGGPRQGLGSLSGDMRGYEEVLMSGYDNDEDDGGGGGDVLCEATTRTTRTAEHSLQTRALDVAPLQATVDRMSHQLTQAQSDLQALQASGAGSQGGTTFVRWGSHQCPNASQVVYSGVVGGSHSGHSGAGANHLCLTMHPVPGNHSTPPLGNYLYGSEYQTYDEHEDKDPVCAVCLSSAFTSTIMVPGTTVCTDGWHLQYSGYLMAGYYGWSSGSQFICVDPVMESRIGADASYDGKLLYYTLTRCGSLPCKPYDTDKVVTCAVCSR